MLKVVVGATLIATVCLTAGVPARSYSVAKKELPVPFSVGETLTYDVSWSSYLSAGTATVRVLEKRPSFQSTAYYVVAEGRPNSLIAKLYSLYYKVDTLLDVYSLLPQRGSVYSEEGKRRRMKTTLFDRPRQRAEYRVDTATAVTKQIGISSAAQDPLGALYVLRSMSLRAGEKIAMPICDSGSSYQVLVQAGGIETVKTSAGDIQTQRLSVAPPAESGARALTLWFSTDAARVPVKMSAQIPVGAFVLTLSSRR